MKEINLDALVTPTRKYTLKGREFYVKDMSIEKSFMATALYQNAVDYVQSVGGMETIKKDAKVAKEYSKRIIKTCLFIAKNQLRYSTTREWLSTVWLGYRWFIRNCSIEPMEEFIKTILEPIIGEESKKKIMAIERQMSA